MCDAGQVGWLCLRCQCCSRRTFWWSRPRSVLPCLTDQHPGKKERNTIKMDDRLHRQLLNCRYVYASIASCSKNGNPKLLTKHIERNTWFRKACKKKTALQSGTWPLVLHQFKQVMKSTSHNSVTSHTHTHKFPISPRDWFYDHIQWGQSPSVIEYHNLLGGCDTQSHLDFDPGAFERRSKFLSSVDLPRTSMHKVSHFSPSRAPIFQGAWCWHEVFCLPPRTRRRGWYRGPGDQLLGAEFRRWRFADHRPTEENFW